MTKDTCEIFVFNIIREDYGVVLDAIDALAADIAPGQRCTLTVTIINEGEDDNG